MIIMYLIVMLIVLMAIGAWFFFFGQSPDERLKKYDAAFFSLSRHEDLLIRARLMELENSDTAIDTDIAYAIKAGLAARRRMR